MKTSTAITIIATVAAICVGILTYEAYGQLADEGINVTGALNRSYARASFAQSEWLLSQEAMKHKGQLYTGDNAPFYKTLNDNQIVYTIKIIKTGYTRDNDFLTMRFDEVAPAYPYSKYLWFDNMGWNNNGKSTTFGHFTWRQGDKELGKVVPFAMAQVLQSTDRQYRGYVIYQVHVTYQKQSIDYQTFALVNSDHDISIFDTMGGSAPNIFSNIDKFDVLYPRAFTQTGERAQPFVKEWLRQNTHECSFHLTGESLDFETSTNTVYLCQHDLDRDMDKPVPTDQQLVVPDPRATANTSCTGMSKDLVPIPDQDADNCNHHKFCDASNHHGGTGSGTTSCDYYNPLVLQTGNACQVTASMQFANPFTWESGALTDLPGYVHSVAVSQKFGTARGTSGEVEADGYAGIGFAPCLSKYCLSLSISGNGSMTFSGGSTIYSAEFAGKNKCPKVLYADDSCGGGDLGNGWCGSPLVLCFDGCHFTGLDHCHVFDFAGNGKSECVAWLDPAHRSMFLTLGNHVTSGRELFGPNHSNGFLQLAEYDDNHDRKITPDDKIWSKLYLWDADGNYFSLDYAGISEIGLDHIEKPVTDRYGNELKLWGKANNVPVVDVWLMLKR